MAACSERQQCMHSSSAHTHSNNRLCTTVWSLRAAPVYPMKHLVQQHPGWHTTTDTFTIGRVCQGCGPGHSNATSSALSDLSRLRAFLTMARRARRPAWRGSCGSALKNKHFCSTSFAGRPECGAAHRAISRAGWRSTTRLAAVEITSHTLGCERARDARYLSGSKLRGAFVGFQGLASHVGLWYQ